MSEGMPLSATPERDPVRVSLAEVFEAHVVELEGSPEALAAARLSAAAGASLMAALDWMAGDSGARRAFQARLDDSCLEVSGWPRDLRGVRAAGEILSLVGGNLHPVTSPAARGLWRLRLPLAVETSSYLMVEQNGVRLALPWTAVLAVVMSPSDGIGKTPLGIPMLPRPETTIESPREIPVVLLAHGLKRAYLAADRLIWRLRADAAESEETPPAPGLVRRMSADDGESYWLAEPGVLLQAVEPPPIPEQAFPLPAPPEPEPAPESSIEAAPENDAAHGEPSAEAETADRSALDAALDALHAGTIEPDPAPIPELSSSFLEPMTATIEPATENGVATIPPEHSPAQSTELAEPEISAHEPREAEAEPVAPADEPAAGDANPAPEPVRPEVATPPPAASPPHAFPPLLRLTPENVEPLLVPESRRPILPVPVSAPPRRAAPRVAAQRHALVAEDSFIARVFLARMLEQRGFQVTPAANTGELFEELPRQRWDLVCVDVDLGDGGGAALLRHLREVLARLAATETRGHASLPPLVALVRDARDIAAARAGGVSLSLLKPFDPAEFASLIESVDPSMEERP